MELEADSLAEIEWKWIKIIFIHIRQKWHKIHTPHRQSNYTNCNKTTYKNTYKVGEWMTTWIF